MKKNKKLREALEKSWGVPKESSFNFGLIEEYFEAKRRKEEAVFLTDKTVYDLDILEFFQFVDRTTSAVGQQYLYARLLEGNQSIEESKKLEADIQFYTTEKEQRLQVQQILKQLDTGNDYYFPFLLYSELPPLLTFIGLIRGLQIVAIVAGIAVFFFPAIVIPLIFLFAINLVLHYWHKNRIGKFAHIFSRITKLIKTVEESLPFTNQTHEDRLLLEASLKKVKKTTAKIFLLKTDTLYDGTFTSMIWYFFELIKIFTLFEVTSFHSLLKELKVVRKDVQQLFEMIGQMDMAISVASLRKSLPYYSLPNL